MMMLTSQRRKLHRKAAEYFEKNSPHSYYQIIHHYENSIDQESPTKEMDIIEKIIQFCLLQSIYLSQFSIHFLVKKSTDIGDYPSASSYGDKALHWNEQLPIDIGINYEISCRNLLENVYTYLYGATSPVKTKNGDILYDLVMNNR